MKYLISFAILFCLSVVADDGFPRKKSLLQKTQDISTLIKEESRELSERELELIEYSLLQVQACFNDYGFALTEDGGAETLEELADRVLILVKKYRKKLSKVIGPQCSCADWFFHGVRDGVDHSRIDWW